MGNGEEGIFETEYKDADNEDQTREDGMAIPEQMTGDLYLARPGRHVSHLLGNA